jgi:hypothetical protein
MGSHEFWASVCPLHKAGHPRSSITQLVHCGHKLILEGSENFGSSKTRLLGDMIVSTPREHLRRNVEPWQAPTRRLSVPLWQNHHECSVPAMRESIGQTEVVVTRALAWATYENECVTVIEPTESARQRK